MQDLGFDLRREAHLSTLTEDVVRSSEIEGERLNSDQVRSSLARRLGMDVGGLVPADRNVDGVVEMMLDATSHYAQPLTAERLFGWHAALFPAGRSGLQKIIVGNWRDDANGPMQVVSGPDRPTESCTTKRRRLRASRRKWTRFLNWFEAPGNTDPLLTAGLAHLWFVTIHPFDDGNGRIARAIGDMALARSERSPQRFYSMSAQIRRERDDYYTILERTQKGDLDVTPWQQWFLSCLRRAIDGSQETLARVLDKARFWDRFAQAVAERAAGQGAQQAARRLRGEAHDVEMGQARQVFAGHGLPRHPGSRRTRRSAQGSGRRAQYELFFGPGHRQLVHRPGPSGLRPNPEPKAVIHSTTRFRLLEQLNRRQSARNGL